MRASAQGFFMIMTGMSWAWLGGLAVVLGPITLCERGKELACYLVYVCVYALVLGVIFLLRFGLSSQARRSACCCDT